MAITFTFSFLFVLINRGQAMEYRRSSESLTDIPLADIPLNVTTLILTDNKLTSLPDYAFSDFKDLEILYVDGNLITEVSSLAFAGTVLNDIYLQYNSLTYIPNFNVLNQTLTSLLMNANPLTNATFEGWTYFENLGYICIYYTGLTYIPVFNIEEIQPSIKCLDLRYNIFPNLTGRYL